MKTAISIPDDVFEAAESLAERLGMSRSELFSTAVAEYVAQHSDREITERLNAVYGEIETELDPTLARMQRRSLPKRW